MATGQLGCMCQVKVTTGYFHVALNVVQVVFGVSIDDKLTHRYKIGR